VALTGDERRAAPEVLVADDRQRPRDALLPHVVVRPEERDEFAAERADRAEVRARRLELHVGRPVHVLGEHRFVGGETHAIAVLLDADGGHRVSSVSSAICGRRSRGRCWKALSQAYTFELAGAIEPA